jgi:hypothetical protein
MGIQLQQRGTMGENQQRQKEIPIHREGLFQSVTNYCNAGDSRTEYCIHFEDPVSMKTI